LEREVPAVGGGALEEDVGVVSEPERNLDQPVPEHCMEHLMPASVDAARRWIRYAFQHGVKSLIMDLRLPEPTNLFGMYCDYDDEDHGGKNGNVGKKPVVVLLDDDLSSPASLETMRLGLGRARLRLPAAMKFASLTDLSLERIKIVDGGARLFARLVSPASCPLLQRLRVARLRFPNFSEASRLEELLSELWVEDVNVVALELRTPRLRVLHVDKLYHRELGVLLFQLRCSPRRIEVDGDLPCVRVLKLYLWSHYCHQAVHCGEQRNNDGSMLILKRCSSVTSLDVTLDDSTVLGTSACTYPPSSAW
jgi:hypothetical protein